MKSKNVDKSAKELSEWFSDTENKEACLQTLVAMQLRSEIMEIVFWARNEEKLGVGLFEYCDPYELADSLVAKLRLFGFMEPPQARYSVKNGGDV